MSVLLQISDPHFGTEQPPVVEALLELAAQLQPNVIVLSGDLTQRARRAQFRAAGKFCDRLPQAPRIVLPGNHDIPMYNVFARLFAPYGGYRRTFGEQFEPTFEDDAFFVIGINTTRPYRRVDGEISPQQIERVANRLRVTPGQRVRVVVTHQPVHVIKEKDEKNVVHGHQAAVRTWTEAGVDVLMGGHIHLPYVRPLSERVADLPRRSWVVQAGTAVSHRVRHSAPNSVNVLRAASTQPLTCDVERWDYDAVRACFDVVERHRLDIDRSST
jgi:3',5'-cyclic AMP phosphodiesterase CpdA